MQRLLSEVAIAVSLDEKASSRYWVSVSPLCPNGSTAENQSCLGVQPDQTVNIICLIQRRILLHNGGFLDITLQPCLYWSLSLSGLTWLYKRLRAFTTQLPFFTWHESTTSNKLFFVFFKWPSCSILYIFMPLNNRHAKSPLNSQCIVQKDCC